GSVTSPAQCAPQAVAGLGRLAGGATRKKLRGRIYTAVGRRRRPSRPFSRGRRGQRSLLGTQRRARRTRRVLARTAQRGSQVRLYDGRVDVAVPADGRRVPEALGHGGHREIDVLLGRRRAIGAGDAQGGQGQHRPSPGSEILRGEFAPGDLADVLVDVGRIDRLPLAGSEFTAKDFRTWA